jgi:hypothetical protein
MCKTEEQGLEGNKAKTDVHKTGSEDGRSLELTQDRTQDEFYYA